MHSVEGFRLRTSSAPLLSPRLVHSTFFLNEHPSVSRAIPPVGWHNMTLQFPQRTTVWAWLYTVVIWRHPGHFTSMKKLLGDWIMRLSLCLPFSSFGSGFNRSISISFSPLQVLLARLA